MAHTLHRTPYVALIWICLICLPAKTKSETVQRSALYGQIESPGYPEPYGDTVDRVWNISVPGGFTIDLYFSLFQLEASYDCEYDYVKFLVVDPTTHTLQIVATNTTTCLKFRSSQSHVKLVHIECQKVSSSKETVTFCGNEQFMEFRTPSDRHMTSPNNNMVVEFQSDFSNVEPFAGFVAHYHATDINECLVNNGGCEQVCHNFVSGYYCSCRLHYQLQPDNHHCKVSCRDLVYSSKEDEFQTPDYPDDYPRNADCNWLIHVDPGYSINIVFETFEIESHPTVPCPYDYAKIYYDNEVRGPFCGESSTDLPVSITTAENFANVTFHSDDTVQRMGFRARYYVTGRSCPPLHSPTYGWISGSNFTFGYSVIFSCKDGYYINGSSSRSCQADGTWSGVQPACDIVKCDAPRPISNGDIVYYSGRNFSYSNSIGFVCNEDYYEMEGMSFSQCGVNGTWTPEPPVCIPICGVSSINPRDPPRGRIVGGRSAIEGSWPWQVFHEINAPKYDFIGDAICGGSLLNEEWIMTAAHCVTGKFEDSETYNRTVPTYAVDVSLGLHKRSMPTEHTVFRTVREIIRHPDFDPVTYDSDLALIHLNESIQFSDFIRPICLPPQNTHFEEDDDERVRIPNVVEGDTTAVVIGWGRISLDQSTSDVLKQVHVGVDVPRVECNENLRGTVTRNMVCAGPREGGRDACQGDSGGPLMLRDATTNRYFTYGVVSWGEGCGREGKFGVYTRIENFVDWVQSKIMVER